MHLLTFFANFSYIFLFEVLKAMSQLYSDLVIPVAVDRLFTYSVPAGLESAAQRGVRAVVPFGNRNVIGIIVELHARKPDLKTIKPLGDILDARPILGEHLLTLLRWISQYYIASLGDVVRSAVIQQALRPSKRIIRLAPAHLQRTEGSLPRHHAAIVDALRRHHQLSIKQLQGEVNAGHIYSTVNELVRQGILLIEEKEQAGMRPRLERTVIIAGEDKQRWREWLSGPEAQKKQHGHQQRLLTYLAGSEEQEMSIPRVLKSSGTSLSTLRTLERKSLVTVNVREVPRTGAYDAYDSALGARDIVLNAQQQNALDEIGAGLRSNEFRSYLLYGVTGSGKTQVYIEAIRTVTGLGKTAIVLVPEISLTPQIVRRFRAQFGEQVVAMHSRLSQGERYDTWRLIREGKSSIVIGPRSAVFAPLQNLGLIVVDEEHESSYKQFDRTPRYHARDLAIMRAHIEHAVVVLGSATPSLESYTNALNGKHILLELPERTDNAQLPRIEIVDMVAERQKKFSAFRAERKQEFREDAVKARASRRPFEFSLLSDTLREHIALRLEKNEGIILLQNRRGFAPIIECPDCGYVETCDNCNITLTYHLPQKHLRCHYCGFVKRPPEVCPKCNGAEIRYRGFGTQRVEEELYKFFPSVRLLRMDLDTTTRKGAHDRILRAFSEGEADILLGTQMVGKGLDFSRVTLVGVISADTQMLLPDFRSAERTFQLLTQVAGRAGRSALAGEVIIQTFQPAHYSLRHVLRHDFRSFYNEEIAYRKELAYPPFSRMVLIECRGKEDAVVQQHISFIAESLRKAGGGYTMLGPAPAAIPRISRQYRWHIVIKDVKSKDPSSSLVHHSIQRAMAAYAASRFGRNRGVHCIIDVDPVGMM